MITASRPGGIAWRKSSYSAANGNCVEVGWRTSSYSGNGSACVEVGWRTSSHSAAHGDCVEVAAAPDHVLVRDSKDSASPVLSFPASTWRAFLGTVRG